jgi:hypothetical protein
MELEMRGNLKLSNARGGFQIVPRRPLHKTDRCARHKRKPPRNMANEMGDERILGEGSQGRMQRPGRFARVAGRRMRRISQ